MDDQATTPVIPLMKATEAEYCHAALNKKANEFWWYFNGLAPYRGFSKPFPDADERWWYRVKPGFAWPVDFFRPFANRPSGLSTRLLLGWQWPVAHSQAESRVWMNVIHGGREQAPRRSQRSS
jgi:hypothetical protein